MLLARAGRCRLRVGGTSMLPAIRPGDTLVVQRVDPSALTVGDVLLTARSHRLRAHRLVAREGEAFVTCGDAIGRCDPPVAASGILGRVVARRRPEADEDAPVPAATPRILAILYVTAFRARLRLVSALRRPVSAGPRVGPLWRPAAARPR